MTSQTSPVTIAIVATSDTTIATNLGTRFASIHSKLGHSSAVSRITTARARR